MKGIERFAHSLDIPTRFLGTHQRHQQRRKDLRHYRSFLASKLQGVEYVVNPRPLKRTISLHMPFETDETENENRLVELGVACAFLPILCSR